jgi:hypothetical protein
MKNSVVTTAIAELFVEVGCLVKVAVFPALAIAIRFVSSPCDAWRFGPEGRFPALRARNPKRAPSKGVQCDPPIISHSRLRSLLAGIRLNVSAKAVKL